MASPWCTSVNSLYRTVYGPQHSGSKAACSLPATLEVPRIRRDPRRAACQADVGPVTVTPAAFAAVRTAPATAPATLSLKTDGMM